MSNQIEELKEKTGLNYLVVKGMTNRKSQRQALSRPSRSKPYTKVNKNNLDIGMNKIFDLLSKSQ
jgi:hypothetical protein